MKQLFLRTLLLFLLSISPAASISQSLNIDSCLQVLKTSQEDTAKVALLREIAWNVSYKNLQEGAQYAEEAVRLVKKLGSEVQYARVFNVAGTIYADMSEQGKALAFFLDGLKYAKKYKQTLVSGYLYNSLGNFYASQNQMDLSVSYYLQAVEAHKKTKLEKPIYTPYNNLSVAYLRLNQPDSAIYYVNLCVQYNERKNDNERLVNNYATLAEIYAESKNKVEALFYGDKAVNIARTLNDNYTLVRALQQQGYAQYVNGKDGLAIKTLNEAVALAEVSRDITSLKSCTRILVKIYEQMADYKNALTYFKQYKSYEDSIINSENINQIRTAEAKYQNHQKQKEIELLAEKQKLSEANTEKDKLYLYLAIGGIAGLGILIILLYRNNRSKHKTNKELAMFNKEINLQKELVDGKNKEITDSINYAQRIQQSLLTSDAYFAKHTRDFFILFKPKDIVSGDFYWALNYQNHLMLMTADCTGHGVPGAMMSMMGINFLNEIVNERKIINPAAVLNQLRKEIISALNPEGSIVETKDGMDCSFCSFDFERMKLRYANANNRFYIIRNKTVIVSEVNKMPVGAGHNSSTAFSDFEIDLVKDDVVITLTDGFADQFGGPAGKKFKYKQLENLLADHGHLPLEEIKIILLRTIETWRGPLEQVDDICIIGIKI